MDLTGFYRFIFVCEDLLTNVVIITRRIISYIIEDLLYPPWIIINPQSKVLCDQICLPKSCNARLACSDLNINVLRPYSVWVIHIAIIIIAAWNDLTPVEDTFGSLDGNLRPDPAKVEGPSLFCVKCERCHKNWRKGSILARRREAL